jgi:ABC-type Fe3+ transport system substrate-binding protein
MCVGAILRPLHILNAATLAFLGCVQAANAQIIEQLYQAAKKEGALVLYGGGPITLYQSWAREFEQRFPGIKVSVKAGSSNELDEEIDAQMKAGHLQVDTAILQTIQDYERWKNAGVLLPFKPEGFDKIDDAWKDKDGAYVGVTVNGLSYAYNREKLPASAVPKSALDFLKPEFKGKIITTFPHVDDVTLYLYQTLVDKYGQEFLDKLKANEPVFVRGHLGVTRAIAAGNDKTLTFDSFVSMSLAEAKTGKMIVTVIPEVDPFPVSAQTAAVFKDAPHPNAAKLYISWYLQPEQQSRQGTWSSRSDVAPPAPLKPLSNYKVANAFRAFIMDEAKAKTLRERYLSFTGPASVGVYR